jgi:hypothetical protein
MELNRANVVQVTHQREEAAAQFVVPHFDFIVVSTGDKERLRAVETDAADGACAYIFLIIDFIR